MRLSSAVNLSSNTPKTFVVITTWNEAGSVSHLVRALRPLPTIVVDNCSDDYTADLASEAGAITVVQRCTIAGGIKAGLAVALEHGADFIVQADAGGSHRVNDIHRVAESIHHANGVVIGSRFAAGADYRGRRWRAVCSRAYSLLLSLRTGYRVSDWTTGLRAFDAVAARLLLQKETRCQWNAWQAESLLLLLRAGFNPVEVSIKYLAGRSSFDWARAAEALQLLRWV